MKKFIYLFMAMGLMLITACNPMEDIYAELDAQEEVITGDVEITLTDEDYDDLDLGFGSFSSLDDVKTMIPPYLTDKYPVWGNGSTALINFKLYIGNAFSVQDYYLSQEDYTFSGSDLLGFQSDAIPTEFLGDILNDNISSPDEGDYVVAKYYQYTGDAYVVTPTVSFEDNFDYGTVDGNITTATGSTWVAHSSADYNPVGYSATSLSMTDYPTSNVGGSILLNNPGNEDVNNSFTSIITTGTVYSSALVNLSSVDSGTYFLHLMEEDGSYNYSGRVGAKSDGSGNVLFGIGASSSSLTYGTTPYDLNTTYLLVATYNVESGISNLYVLTSVLSTEPSVPEATNTGNSGNSANRIGIRQGSGGPTGTIDGVRVANSWSAIMSNDVLEDEVVGDKMSYEMGYYYSEGAWDTAPDRFYLVTDEDFDSMGEESGQPGRYNNFGSSTPPGNYLPTFLNLKFPYAQEGDELDVVYDYFSSSSGAQVRGNLYTFIEGSWVGYESTINTSLQFGHDGNSWVPDNTIKYSLTGADISIITDALSATYPGPTSNVERFGSFDRREGSSNYWSDAMLLEGFNILLDTINPSAEEGQKYVLSYVVYVGATADETMSLIKTGGVWVLN